MKLQNEEHDNHDQEGYIKVTIFVWQHIDFVFLRLDLQ